MSEPQLFLFIVDTTENQFANVGRGILNAQLIYAKDKVEAKELFVKIYRPNILQQIQNHTYVYDLSEIQTNLKTVDVSKSIPVFSHLPLQGGRPPKPEPLIMAPQAQPVARPQSTPSPTGNPNFTQEQLNLIKTFGAVPTPNGENAGFNPRINASTGYDGRLSQNMVQTPDSVQKLSSQQLELLKATGVKVSDLNMNIEIENPVVQETLTNSALAVVEEQPLSDAEIELLKQQIK